MKKNGRPKGSKNKKTIEQELALEQLREKVREKWGPLLEAKMDLALGLKVVKQTWSNGKKVGEEYVYKEKPDSGSIEYLQAMVVGKPKGNLDMNIAGKGIEKIQNNVKKILDKKDAIS